MPSVLNVTVCPNEIRKIYLSPRVHRQARLGGYETLVAHKLHAVHRGEITRHACRFISNLGFVD